ncbi:hypothetical protein [Actibacterium sp. D379-3]
MLLDVIIPRLKEVGMSDAEASERTVGNPHLIANMKRPRYGMPSIEKLSSLADVLGLELYFGPQRPAATGHLQSYHLAEAGSNMASQVIAPLGAKEALRGGYLPIPYHRDDRTGEKGAGPFAVANGWIADSGLDPVGLSFVTVRNSRMSPTLDEGDLALIEDLQPKEPDNDVWCASDKGDVGFARVTMPTRASYILSYDSLGCAPAVYSGSDFSNVRLLGRVVCVFRSIKG